MKRSLASLSLFALAGALSFATTGCIVGECDNGQDNCIQAESTIEYTGAESSESAAYEDGQAVVVSGVNGDIDVRVGGSEVKATFSPFTRNKNSDEGKTNATNEIKDKLVLSVTPGDPVKVSVSRRDGSSSFLGAHVLVTLPSSFNGDLEVQQGNGSTAVSVGNASPTATKIISDNGDIECTGAAGSLDIQTDNGDIALSVASWAADGEGTVLSGLGDISISVPSDANGSLSLYAPDEDVNATLPADWTKDEEAPNSVTYTMGTGEGAHVTVTAESLSSISAKAN